MQPLTKRINRTGTVSISRGNEPIAHFFAEVDADIYLQAEAMFAAADLSLQAGLNLLKERNQLAAERDAFEAQSKRLRNAGEALFHKLHESAWHLSECRQPIRAWLAVRDESPQTSLSRQRRESGGDL